MRRPRGAGPAVVDLRGRRGGMTGEMGEEEEVVVVFEIGRASCRERVFLVV